MADLNFAAELIENSQNKVDTINPDTATDKQYPSVPAVVKYVKNVGSDKNYANNSFANALKGAASGASVYVEDVSPLEHDVKIKLMSGSVTDFSGVSAIVAPAPISAFEPNMKKDGPGIDDAWDCITYENGNVEYILRAPYETYLECSGGKVDTALTDRIIIFERTDFDNFSRVVLEGNAEAYAVYTSGSENKMFYFPISNFSMGGLEDSGEYTEIYGTFTIPNTVDGYTYGENGAFARYRINEFRIKLIAEGNDENEDAIVVTASADGAIEGVKSFYPSMAITTDNSEVAIKIEYNKDINKLEASTGDVVTMLTSDDFVNGNLEAGKGLVVGDYWISTPTPIKIHVGDKITIKGNGTPGFYMIESVDDLANANGNTRLLDAYFDSTADLEIISAYDGYFFAQARDANWHIIRPADYVCEISVSYNRFERLEKAVNTYELVEEITTTEDGNIDRNATPEGVLYSKLYKNLLVSVSNPNGTACTFLYVYRGNTACLTGLKVAANEFGVVKSEVIAPGIAEWEATKRTSSEYASSVLKGCYETSANVSRILVGGCTAGTIIKIYGIKA